MGLFNENIGPKRCELCGEETVSYIFRLIGQVDYSLLFHNSHIVQHNEYERYVILDNGKRIDYSIQINSEIALKFDELIPHIFCSENCENKFIKKYSSFFRPDLHDKYVFLAWKKNNVFVPVSFRPEVLNASINSCYQCGHGFPNFHKIYKVADILESQKEKGVIGVPPKSLNDFGIAFSNIYENNKEGYYFLYKTNSKFENFHFCSNECALDYCKKNDSLAIFRNNIEKGTLRAITPDLIEINQGLDNDYIFRPLFFKG